MTREALTKEHIEKDLADFINDKSSQITDQFLSNFLPLTALGIIISVALSHITHPIVSAVAYIPAAYCLIRYISRLRDDRSIKARAVADGYTVTTDALISVSAETAPETRRTAGGSRLPKEAKFMNFPCGRWRIPRRVYAWSDTFSMSCDGLDNTSLPGDTFYIASVRGTGEIFGVYNTKFFDYKEVIRSKTKADM